MGHWKLNWMDRSSTGCEFFIIAFRGTDWCQKIWSHWFRNFRERARNGGLHQDTRVSAAGWRGSRRDTRPQIAIRMGASGADPSNEESSCGRWGLRAGGYRGSSSIRNAPLQRPYGRTVPRVLWWSWGGGLFLMNELTL